MRANDRGLASTTRSRRMDVGDDEGSLSGDGGHVIGFYDKCPPICPTYHVVLVLSTNVLMFP